MDLTATIRSAVKAVDDAEVPDDLRADAFRVTLEVLLVGRGHTSDGPPPAPEPTQGGSGSSLLSQLALRLGVDSDLVSDVFHEDEENEIGIGLAASKFDKTRSGATRQIALLVAAGRQAAGIEDWTPTGVIRDVCRDYGKFDTANFATTLRSMGDEFNFRGRAQQLEIRVTRPGLERAARLIEELRG